MSPQECELGEAFVTLRGWTWLTLPPFFLHKLPSQAPQAYRGPAYQRRQERRRAARTSAENVAKHAENANDPQPSDGLNVTASDQVGDEATEIPTIEEINVNEAEDVSEFFECILCDFRSNWNNGLKIHITRKHGEIEQLDGNTTENDESADERYAGTKHYWEFGRLGTVYQTFLDANDIIDKSTLDKDDKEIEKDRILDARKTAFGKNFLHFPPWS